MACAQLLLYRYIQHSMYMYVKYFAWKARGPDLTLQYRMNSEPFKILIFG